MTEWAYLALGSNQGDREAHLAAARRAIAAWPDTELRGETPVEETAPLGGKPQAPYLNQMLLVGTALDPLTVLDAAQRVEHDTGRVRRERWDARTLDIDVVRFGDRTIDHPRLQVPHPAFAHRAFWLREHADLTAGINDAGVPEWAEVEAPRRAHIRRVAALVETWGVAMGTAPSEWARWVRAAFLHDALRDAPVGRLRTWSDGAWDLPELFHGPAAARIAAEHGESDVGVLAAVRYHSVGWAEWDDVGRMLFLADYLDWGRRFLRARRAQWAADVPRHPKRRFVRVVRRRIRRLIRDHHPLLPETVALWNALVASG